MSRLWPEHFTVGLFDGYCWLQGRAGTERIEEQDDGPEGTIGLFQQAIDRIVERGGRKSRVSVLLSDSFARIALLPWQSQVRDEAQLRAYTLACFERAGTKVGPEYAIHSAYRHFGQPAMAMALPVRLLDLLSAQAAGAGVRMRKVSTISAAAYWHRPRPWRREDCAVYLCERDRLTLMRVASGCVVARDVQPIGDSLGIASKRLAQRDTRQPPGRIELWAPYGHEIDQACFKELYPDATIERAPVNAWRLA